MDTSEKDLTEQIQQLMHELRLAEQTARQLLCEARARRRSFGFEYNYLDEDIAHTIGRLRHMQLMAMQWEGPPTRSDGQQERLPQRVTNLQQAREAHAAHAAQEAQNAVERTAERAMRDDHRAS